MRVVNILLINLLIVACFAAVPGAATIPMGSAATAAAGTVHAAGTATGVFAFPALKIVLTFWLLNF